MANILPTEQSPYFFVITFYKAKGLREQKPLSGCGCLTQDAITTEDLFWWPVWNLSPVWGLCQCPLTLGQVVVKVGAYFEKRTLGFQGRKEKFLGWPSRNPYGSIREELSKKWVKGQVIHASKLTVLFRCEVPLCSWESTHLTTLQRTMRIKIFRHSFQSKSLFSEFLMLQPFLWMEGTLSGRVTE